MIRYVERHLRHTSHRDPTAAELAAMLQADPDLAVEVVGLLRVAGPWEAETGCWVRYQARRKGSPRMRIARVWQKAGAWGAAAVGQAWEELATQPEARAAADAALVAAGWALAGER